MIGVSTRNSQVYADIVRGSKAAPPSTATVNPTVEPTQESTPSPTDYDIETGKDGEWVQGSEEGFSISSTADISKLDEIQVDDETVDPSNYTVDKTKGVITITSEYMKTLSAGEHTITIVYEDGQAETVITIDEAATPSSPTTGDNMPIVTTIILLVISAAGLLIITNKQFHIFKK